MSQEPKGRLRGCLSCNQLLSFSVPKYVTIQNPACGLIYWFIMAVSAAVMIFYFAVNNNYLVQMTPDQLEVSACSEQCAPTPSQIDQAATQALTRPYCSGGLTYAGQATTYSVQTCVQRCGAASSAGSCLKMEDYVQVDGDNIFFPTFYRETMFAPVDASGTCPTGFSYISTQRCMNQKDYFVAGVEKAGISFNSGFRIWPWHNTLSGEMMKDPSQAGHSGAPLSQGYSKELLSVIFGPDGSELTRFSGGKPVNVTLQDLLAASTSDWSPSSSSTAGISLDSKFTRPDVGIPNGGTGGAPLRLTGAKVTVDLFLTNTGKCEIYDIYRTYIRTVNVKSWDGPVACITAYVEPTWVTQVAASSIGLTGSRKRETSGIRVTFRKMSGMSFMSEQAIISNVTIFFVWLQIPMIFLYWICVTCLGRLSWIYQRAIVQDVNLGEACQGFAARLLSHSSAYYDLQDSAGLTRKRIIERFQKYYESTGIIDEKEVQRYAEFAFQGLKSFSARAETQLDVVTIQEFCATCSNVEPMTPAILVKLFDKDRKLGLLERVFLDKALKEVKLAAVGPSESAEEAEHRNETPHSRLHQACSEVQGLMNKLVDLDTKSRETLREMDVDPEALGLFGPPAQGIKVAGSKLTAEEPNYELLLQIPDEADEAFAHNPQTVALLVEG